MNLALSCGVALALLACGGPPHLAVELGGPVEVAIARSSGFDAELIHDNGKATFMGERLPSPTSYCAYDKVDILVSGLSMWHLDGPVVAAVNLIDGVVVEVEIQSPGHLSFEEFERFADRVLPRFELWQQREAADWQQILRDLRACPQSGKTQVKNGGYFVASSGVGAQLVAQCVVSPSGVGYSMDISMKLASESP